MHDSDEEVFLASFSGVNLYRLLSKDRKNTNCVVGTKSVSEVMKILRHGSSGDTKLQIEKVFHCKQDLNGVHRSPKSQSTKLKNAARKMVRKLRRLIFSKSCVCWLYHQILCYALWNLFLNTYSGSTCSQYRKTPNWQAAPRSAVTTRGRKSHFRSLWQPHWKALRWRSKTPVPRQGGATGLRRFFQIFDLNVRPIVWLFDVILIFSVTDKSCFGDQRLGRQGNSRQDFAHRRWKLCWWKRTASRCERSVLQRSVNKPSTRVVSLIESV